MSKQLGVRVSEGLYDAVEVRRRELGQSRVWFVARALEAALGQTDDTATSSAARSTQPLPVSPRAPDVHPDLGLTKARLDADRPHGTKPFPVRPRYVKPFNPRPKS